MPENRLLYIGNKLSSKGGTVTSIETLGMFLRKEGYTVYMASSKKNKALRLIHMQWAVVRYRNKVDVVLIDTYSTKNFHFAVAVGNLCRLFRIPYIPILRGGDLPARLKKSASQSWKLFNGAKTNVSPSGYLMAQFHEEGYSNLTLIPNSIEIVQYPFKHRNNISAKLLWVRSFAELYNPMLAVTLVQRLLEEGIDVSLCMVGPDKDGSLDRCKAFSEAHKLPIMFTGKLEKAAWLELAAEYDIFINTTNFDNTPVSVIEAMALGLPVISTNVGGIPFLLDHQNDALVVAPNDVEQFVVSVQSLIRNPELVLTLTSTARAKVESFDWEKVKLRWEELLKP